jgi:hypothetical protein
MKEITAQLIHQLRKGMNVRLLFKIGKLLSKGGELTWKCSLKEDLSTPSRNDEVSKSAMSRAMVSSILKKDLSVLTPSCAKTRTRSIAASFDQKSFHMSNPNP